jgi:PAS domain-containing protein
MTLLPRIHDLLSEAERLSGLEDQAKHNDALEGVDIDDPVLRSTLLQSGSSVASDAPLRDNRGIVIINAQSVIQIVSDSVAILLGHTKSELKGKSLRTILPPLVADSHFSYVRNYVTSGRGGYLCELDPHRMQS